MFPAGRNNLGQALALDCIYPYVEVNWGRMVHLPQSQFFLSISEALQLAGEDRQKELFKWNFTSLAQSERN